jgi:hypothetical protein
MPDFEYWSGYVVGLEENGFWAVLRIPDGLDLLLFIQLEQIAKEDRSLLVPGALLSATYDRTKEEVVEYKMSREVWGKEEVEAAKARAEELYKILSEDEPDPNLEEKEQRGGPGK